MSKEKKKIQKEKPLEKMTAKELRELALSLGEIVGVHGMDKEELIVAIKKVKGIPLEVKKSGSATSVRELKKKILALKDKKVEASQEKNRKASDIIRRRINRLKKMTRKAA
ncbi:MAG: transcription termination factor Rho [Deltaproteobacteria bacterium]|nr:transcription termination factor Rho [Deltaproteobacteria bacterium]